MIVRVVLLENQIRGIFSWVEESFREGSHIGVLGLIVAALPLLILITQYNDFWGDNIGYGLTVFLLNMLLRGVFLGQGEHARYGNVGNIVSAAGAFYGLRLASYIYIREKTGYNPYDPNKAFPRWMRVPEAVALATLFAFMVTPSLFLLQSPPTTKWGNRVACVGACLACLGVSLEALADVQKFSLKRKQKSMKVFCGPVTGVYKWCRHPNYAGEIMYWVGNWISGAPSFIHSRVVSVCATLGLMGILTVVIFIATRHTERKQQTTYRGQDLYEEWRKQVPSTLIPIIPLGSDFVGCLSLRPAKVSRS